MLEHPENAHREFERYRAAQIAVDIDKDTLERFLPKGHVNMLGLIIKESTEKRTLRLVVDMRRSNANARAAVPERPILPRPRDVVADREELFFRSCLLGSHVRSRCFLRYCHVRLFRRTFSCFGAPRRTQELFGRGSAFTAWIRSKRCAHVPHGLAALAWCRIAAALGRAAQAMLMGARWSGHVAGRINTYIHDPLLNLLGTQTQRDKQLRAVLLFWTAAGCKVAWAKGTRSKVAKWIGPEFSPDFPSHTSPSESQSKLQLRSSKMRKNCWTHRCCF